MTYYLTVRYECLASRGVLDYWQRQTLAATVSDIAMESFERSEESASRKTDMLFKLLKTFGLGFLFVKRLEMIIHNDRDRLPVSLRGRQ